MIRVLWEIPDAKAWTGGLNYFCNLARALASLPEKTVEPVLAGVPGKLPESLRQLPVIPRYSVPPASFWPPRRMGARLRQMMGGEDLEYDRYLRQHRIDVLSHLTFPAGKTGVPLLAWIPDFQHRHLPQLFSLKTIDSRTKHYAKLAETAQGILLSSEDARKDFNRFHPGYEGKTHVLRFVAIPPPAATLPPAEQVLAKHGIAEPFFHIPNQIWAHKNHGVVLDALCQLRQRGSCPLVISTGQPGDYRHPEYFQRLVRQVKDAGMEERYRFLGLVDYAEACVLMRSAMALINPSLFEGWSTTVEEAKSMGKRMLLSSLAVHKEQAPGRSLFFDPQDAGRLAALMEETLAAYDPTQETAAMQKAAEALPERIRAFGREYEAIVHRVAGGES